MFGLQYFGECWSGKDALLNYDKYGRSDNCINGVGKASTNYVYRIKGKLHETVFMRLYRLTVINFSWFSIN